MKEPGCGGGGEGERELSREREREEIKVSLSFPLSLCLSISLSLARLGELEHRILEQWYKSKQEEKVGKALLLDPRGGEKETEKGDKRRKTVLCSRLSVPVFQPEYR